MELCCDAARCVPIRTATRENVQEGQKILGMDGDIMNIASLAGVNVTVEAEHKDGKGNLIARSVSIQSPSQPKCTKPKCLWKFFWAVVFCDLLSTYHRDRVEYAEKYRRREIPLKYRTGDSPQNIQQAIFAIIRLRLRR